MYIKYTSMQPNEMESKNLQNSKISLWKPDVLHRIGGVQVLLYMEQLTIMRINTGVIFYYCSDGIA